MQVEVGSLTPHVASLDDSLVQALEMRIIRRHHSASAFRFPQQPSDGPSSQHTPLSAVSNKNVIVLTGCNLEGHACRWGHSAVQPQSVQLWEGVSVPSRDLVRSQGGDLGSQCLLYLTGTRIASGDTFVSTLSSGASEPLSAGPALQFHFQIFGTMRMCDTY